MGERPVTFRETLTDSADMRRWTAPASARDPFAGDRMALARDMAARVRGEVRFERQSRSLYAVDSSNYRQIPLGVVLPRDRDDLVEAVAVCREHGAPITHRGAGTSLAGQTTNAAVIIDSSKYLTALLDIDPEHRTSRVQPGVRRDDVAHRAEAEYGLTFGPDTSTHQWATLGGMIGNNSCGMHSEMAGKTSDNVEELEVLLYDGTRLRVGATSEETLQRRKSVGGRVGEIYTRLDNLRHRYAELIRATYPDIPRRVSGYNLDELLPENGFHVARSLVGTEGTCVTVLEATLRLVPSPPERVLVVLGFPDVVAAGHAVALVKELKPTALEGLDDVLVQSMKLKRMHPSSRDMLPDGDGWLIVEFGGETSDEAEARARELVERLRDRTTGARVLVEAEQQARLWAVRESGLGATARVPHQPDTWPGWEDSACPPERIGDYLEDLRQLLQRFGYRAALYGHFGQGCVHTRIPFDLRSHAGIEKFRRFMHEATDLCLRYGGSLSAEHGDGQARGELLPKMFGNEICEAFREFKSIWDPDWRMNPGKVVDPYRMDENLRLGTGYAPPDLKTHFAYPEDGGSFHRAVLRCVGVGRCRRTSVADSNEVMCPSYLVTHEEKHSTRGRARLLFEMLNGAPADDDPWKDEDVRDALDLCLSCKGCKSDCPVNVDIATYKAEFLSHYYERHRRPRHAYVFGQIARWARLGSRFPRVANWLTRKRAVEWLAKRLTGMAAEREIPRLATQTFRTWFEQRHASSTRHPVRKAPRRVLLWADTFNNYFTPAVARAAVDVLEGAGCDVVVPQRELCCGRPLYDYGWIAQAREQWRETLVELRDDIRAGTAVVGLEPSCVAAFRDELPNLLPHDWDAKRLTKQTYTLAEFLNDELEDYDPPQLTGRVLFHGHCHHKSIMGLDADLHLLAATGVERQVPSVSCCGMAGAFGFEAEHYDISRRVGENALLPAVRDASADTRIVTDGFSCREQIRQLTRRRALHLAELLATAAREDANVSGIPGTRRESPIRAS